MIITHRKVMIRESLPPRHTSVLILGQQRWVWVRHQQYIPPPTDTAKPSSPNAHSAGACSPWDCAVNLHWLLIYVIIKMLVIIFKTWNSFNSLHLKDRFYTNLHSVHFLRPWFGPYHWHLGMSMESPRSRVFLVVALISWNAFSIESFLASIL